MPLERGKFKQLVIENALRSCQLFLGLPATDIFGNRSLRVYPKQLAKGEYLFREGSPAEGFYIVQRGAINVHRVSAAGKEQVIHLFQPDGIVRRSDPGDRGWLSGGCARDDESTVLPRAETRISSPCCGAARNSRCGCSAR